MRKFVLAVAAMLLCASPSWASFGVTTPNVSVTYLGSYSGTTSVDILAPGTLVDGASAQTLTGSFKAYRITKTAHGDSSGTSFGRTLAAVYTTSLGTSNGGLNVIAAFEAATGISTGIAGALGLETSGSGADGLGITSSGFTYFDASTFNTGYDSFVILTAVPEPTTMAIWGLGSIVGLGAVRLRKRALKA